MKCPSCIAANVAIAATTAIGITDRNVAGITRKSSNPVSLLAHVCGKQNHLWTTRAETWFTILMKTITPAQIHNHVGISSTGIIRIAQQATKAMSATLSNTAPALVSAWSFLASQPSIISLIPHNA